MCIPSLKKCSTIVLRHNLRSGYKVHVTKLKMNFIHVEYYIFLIQRIK